MSRPSRLIAVAMTLLVALAACGGGGGAAPGAANSAATGQSQPAPAQSQAGAEPAPSAAPADGGTTPAAGGAAGNVCALVTGDELGGALGQPVATSVIAGPPDTCDIQSMDGAPLAAFVLTNMGGLSASAVYDAYASDPASQAVSGIGEKAAYNPDQGTLVILKNGAVLSVAVFDDGSGATDANTRFERMKQIGSLAAGRM